MTYEVELRLPSSVQYSFGQIKVAAGSVEELEYRVNNELAKVANLVGAALGTANAVFLLAEAGVVSSVQQTPPAVAAAPWDQPAQAPTPPWQQAAPAIAGPPVESSGPPPFGPAVGGPPVGGPPAGGPPVAQAPAGGNTFRARFSVPDEKWEQFRTWSGNFYKNNSNSFQKNKDTGLYQFFRAPTEAMKLEVRQYAEYFGGEIVSE